MKADARWPTLFLAPSCSWIFKSSIGVVTTVWQNPANPPAVISLGNVSFLQQLKQLKSNQTQQFKSVLPVFIEEHVTETIVGR